MEYTCLDYPQSPSDCRALVATAVLSFVQALFMVVWMFILVRDARIMSGRVGKGMKEVYEIPARKLLKGDDGFREV